MPILIARLLLVLLLGLVPVACTPEAREEPAAAPAPAGIAVDAQVARRGTLLPPVEVVGITTPVRDVVVRARSAGRLEQLHVGVGDAVTAGDEVARMEDDLLDQALQESAAALAAVRAEVASAATAVQEARFTLEQARTEAERYSQLAARGLVSRQEAEQRSTQAQTTAERLQSQQALLQAARERVSAQEALAATEGVVQVYSQTREGQVSLSLFFQPGDDVNTAITDATATVNRVRGNLPTTAESPQIIKLDPTQLPVLELALTSTLLPLRELRLFADEELARELIIVPGVAAVDVSGGVQEEVQVFLDLERLQASGLSIPHVFDTITANNLDVSGGRLEARDREALVRTVGRFRTAEEIAALALPVDAPASSPVAFLLVPNLSTEILPRVDTGQGRQWRPGAPG